MLPHPMDKNMVHHSSSDSIRNYCLCFSIWDIPWSVLPCTFSSLRVFLSTVQPSTTSTLWTGLYWFLHIISHKCDQFWVVVFEVWQLWFCYLCFPLCNTSTSQCKMCFSEWEYVCKLCLTRWKVLMDFTEGVTDSINSFRPLSICSRR